MEPRQKHWAIMAAPIKAAALRKITEEVFGKHGWQTIADARQGHTIWLYEGSDGGSILMIEGKESAAPVIEAIAALAGPKAHAHTLRGVERGADKFEFESKDLEDTSEKHGDFEETGLHYAWTLIEDLPADRVWHGFFSSSAGLAPRLAAFARAAESAGKWTVTPQGARHLVSVDSPATGKQMLVVDDNELAQLRAVVR